LIGEPTVGEICMTNVPSFAAVDPDPSHASHTFEPSRTNVASAMQHALVRVPSALASVPMCQCTVSSNAQAATGVPSARVVPPVPAELDAPWLMPTASAGTFQLPPVLVAVYIRPCDQKSVRPSFPPNTIRRSLPPSEKTTGAASRSCQPVVKTSSCWAMEPLVLIAV
jgi:hypothetical protein